ncbi:NFACT family protein [Bacillota bacterium Meth-B3]
MPMDGLTLYYMARELSGALSGGRVDKVTQPERDELLIAVRAQGRSQVLLMSANAGTARAHLTQYKKNNPLEPPMLCMLLRKHLVSGRVAGVRQALGDRILELDVQSCSELGDARAMTLVCEFMGKHSNLILVGPDGRIVDCARHVTGDISRVREVLPGLPYERPPEQGKLRFDEPDEGALAEALTARDAQPLARALADCLTGLSRQSAQELALCVLGDEAAQLHAVDAAQLARRVSAWLRNPPAPDARLVLNADGAPLDVTAFPYRIYDGLEQRALPSLSEAMDAFYREKDLSDRARQKSAALRRVLKNNVERCEKKLALQLEALEGSGRMEEYRVKGELLVAAQAQIRKGQKSVTLPNYYDPACEEIEVALDVQLSPGQNAQRYFKLYQKARSARTLAAEQKEKTEEELRYFEGQLFNLDGCEDEAALNEIREELEALRFVRSNRNRRQLKKLPPSRPLHYLSSTGAHILVGRNNLQNDRLTQGAQPDETWLHAKDMPGSHVIIVGANPDERTLHEAALLAARHSKGGASSRVPVDYTLRKHVKKPSGAKPGYVIYTHQRTLYVTPDEEALKVIREADTTD